MASLNGAVLCLAYILGLLLTALPWQVRGLPVGAIALLLLGVGAAFLAPRFWKTGPKSRTWLIAGVVGLLAVLHFQIRLPEPRENDISQFVSQFVSNSSISTSSQMIEVRGHILSSPRLTQRQRLQFWLEATQVSWGEDAATSQTESDGIASQAVTGKLYVTVPLLQGTGLHPGQFLAVKGSPYRPKPATNPGGFNFEAYLAQQGGFAGLNGDRVDLLEEEERFFRRTAWGWWMVRQRIVRSQVHGLGVPEGPLVSAMVMGRNGVDLPYDLRNEFAQIGLAHALAASGFQVSLLVGLMLALTQRLPAKARFGLGASVLIVYIGLTGLQPAVLRAGIMGFAALVALTAERKVKPLASVLLAATLLLLFNPLWVWDLGFQLSFLATVGLLVTVPPLVKWLDWLPPAIATLAAVPIAAYLWTLPLVLFAFGVASPYSIPVNIVTTPLIALVSIGGMVSALAALIWSPAGSALAWLLYYPAHGLIAIAEFCNRLPGNAIAIGTISVLQVVILYGLFGLVWWQSRWQRYWWLVSFVSISLVAIPAWYTYTNLVQVTVLATSRDSVLVVQDKGNVTLVNSGGETNANFTVLPFLKRQGINQIDWAVMTDSRTSSLGGWYRILEDVPIQLLYGSAEAEQGVSTSTETQGDSDADSSTSLTQVILDTLQTKQGAFLPLPASQTVQLGSTSLQTINVNPTVLQFRIGDQSWLLLGNLQMAQQQELIAAKLPPTQVLWWSGGGLTIELLEAVHPKVAIASSASIDSDTTKRLNDQAVETYSTGQNGAVQWTPQAGFTTTLESAEDGTSL